MSTSEPPFQRLAIVGVGLIGGSIGTAVKQRGLAKTVLGCGRDAGRLRQAVELGILDEFVTRIEEIGEADLVVVCTPVDRVAADVAALLDSTSSTTLITDAGSVKGNIIRAISDHPQRERFIGSHPLAGSHLTGFENSDPQLYQDRVCVLTPTVENGAEAVAQVKEFWRRLGMQTVQFSHDEHDRILALTSHVPHLAAAAVAYLVDERELELAASGFRDTTRIAEADPNLWTAIYLQNKECVIKSLGELISVLTRLKESIETEDVLALHQLLSTANSRRQLYRDRHTE